MRKVALVATLTVGVVGISAFLFYRRREAKKDSVKDFEKSPDFKPYKVYDSCDIESECSDSEDGNSSDETSTIVKGAEELKRKGDEYHKEKRYEESVKLYGLAAEQYRVLEEKAPDLIKDESISKVYMNQAASYMNSEKYEEALGSCELAIKSDSKCLKAWGRRYKALKRLNRLEESLYSVAVLNILQNANGGKQRYISDCEDRIHHLIIKIVNEKINNNTELNNNRCMLPSWTVLEILSSFTIPLKLLSIIGILKDLDINGELLSLFQKMYEAFVSEDFELLLRLLDKLVKEEKMILEIVADGIVSEEVYFFVVFTYCLFLYFNNDLEISQQLLKKSLSVLGSKNNDLFREKIIIEMKILSIHVEIEDNIFVDISSQQQLRILDENNLVERLKIFALEVSDSLKSIESDNRDFAMWSCYMEYHMKEIEIILDRNSYCEEDIVKYMEKSLNVYLHLMKTSPFIMNILVRTLRILVLLNDKRKIEDAIQSVLNYFKKEDPIVVSECIDSKLRRIVCDRLLAIVYIYNSEVIINTLTENGEEQDLEYPNNDPRKILEKSMQLVKESKIRSLVLFNNIIIDFNEENSKVNGLDDGILTKKIESLKECIKIEPNFVDAHNHLEDITSMVSYNNCNERDAGKAIKMIRRSSLNIGTIYETRLLFDIFSRIKREHPDIYRLSAEYAGGYIV